MSADFMVCKKQGRLGTRAQVKQIISEELPGIDLWSGVIVGSDWVLETSVDEADGEVQGFSFTPRARVRELHGRSQILGPWRAILTKIARAVGATSFDCQSGEWEGESLPKAIPSMAQNYTIQFVSPMMPMDQPLGEDDLVWSELSKHLDVTKDQPNLSRSGWAIKVNLHRNKRTRDSVFFVSIEGSWENGPARADLLVRLRRISEDANWVPFDPQTNDTIDFERDVS